MKRTDNLQENKATQMVKQLITDVTAFKSTERISGRSGLLGYSTQSGSTWDLTGTVGSDSDSTKRVTLFNAVFTGDGSQVVTMANVTLLIYVDGTDTAHQLTPQTPTWTDGTHTASIQYQSLDVFRNVYTQPVQLTTTKSITYYFKALATASCPGTISVST